MGLYHKECPVNVSISAWEWGAYLGEEGLKKGVRVKITSVTRTPNTSGMGKAKAVANYLNSQMAKFEAVEAGYDEEYGARPLTRAIQKFIEDPVSEEILKGNVKEGQTIMVSYSKVKEKVEIKVV